MGGNEGSPAEEQVTSHAEVCLARAEWQRVLFAPAPRRLGILKLRPSWPLQSLRLRIHRNHSFEPVASVLANYLAYAGFSLDVAYSAYDDSLSFGTPGHADAELIWLDYSRLLGIGTGETLALWAMDRVEALRSKSNAPILVADAPGDIEQAPELNAQLQRLAEQMPDVHICEIGQIHAQLGPAYFDDRALASTGTRMSNAACVQAARMFGSRWLPASVAPRIKALVLDLDNTLYEGVLGEDGPDGVRLGSDHLSLQQRVVELAEEGIFVALCSRNDPADVERLFAARSDFPLRLHHVAASQISWAPKGESLRRIAKELRIGTDAILFVDDNPGELASVASAVPDVHTLYAGPTGGHTFAGLTWYPRLFRWRADETDSLRTNDLSISRMREGLAAKTTDKVEYMRSLAVRLQFTRNVRQELERLSSLSNKTNQFNLSLRRFSLAELARFVAAPEISMIGVRLSDRLSDSGIIGAMITRQDGAALIIEDFCISCRALGRNLEDVIAIAAIKTAATGSDDIECLKFCPAVGPRNQPARDWLASFAATGGGPLDAEGWVTVPWDSRRAEDLASSTPVIIEHEIAVPSKARA
jgi:FkbH-like protein